MPKQIKLTDNELRVLTLILRVDMDALGLDRKDQPAVRSILKKIGA